MKTILHTSLILIILFVCSSITAIAANGWQRIDADLYGAAIAGESTFVCVGEAGKIMRSMDAGATWEWVRSPVEIELTSLAFATAERGVAVGKKGTILLTKDAGATWQQIANSIEADLKRIVFASADTGFAVGAAGTVLRTVDGGSNWTVMRTQENETLNGVSFIDALHGVAVGHAGLILHTMDGGVSWNIRESNTTMPLFSVALCSRDSGMIAGQTGLIFSTADGGLTWTQTAKLDCPKLHALTWVDRLTAIAAGTKKKIFRTTDGGKSWLPLDISGYVSNNATIRDVAILGAIGIAVGHSSLILSAFNQGEVWERRSYMKVSESIARTYSIGSIQRIAGTHLIGSGNHGGLYWSADNGMTWGSVDSPTFAAFKGMYIANPDTVYVLDDLSGSYVSHDSGRTWQAISLEVGNYSYQSVFVSPSGIISIAADTTLRDSVDGKLRLRDASILLQSSDNRQTWQIHYFPDTYTSRKVLFVNESLGFFLAQSSYTSAALWRTTDGGAQWTPVAIDTGIVFYNISFINEQKGFMVGEKGSLYRTMDAGQSWQRVEHGAVLGENDRLTSVEFLDASRGFIAGTLSPGEILVTENGGETWRTEQVYDPAMVSPEVMSKTVTGIICMDDSLVFLTGGATLIRKVFSPATSVVETGKKKSNPYLYMVAFPTPARQETIVRVFGLYSVPDTPLSLVVYDLFGQKIMDLSQEVMANHNGYWSDVTVDVNNFSNGVYILHLQAGEASYSSRLLVVH